MVNSQLLADVLAVLAAGFYAGGADLQQSEAHQVAPDESLLRRLLTRPRWFAGIAVNAVGLVLQASALRWGALLAVQPLLTLSVVFCLPLSRRRTRVPVTVRDVAAAVGVVLGLAILVATVRPGDPGVIPAAQWLWASLVLAVAAGACAGLARGRLAAPLLGIGGGLLCGLGATLMKATVEGLSTGVLGLLTSWPLYACIAATAAGFWLMQRSFQTGSLVASFPALIATDPLTSAWLGIWLYHDRLDPAWLGILGTLTAVAALAALNQGRPDPDSGPHAL